jgi:hypothetical protein
MQVATGGGHRRVAEGGLDQVDSRAALERVRRVAMAIASAASRSP